MHQLVLLLAHHRPRVRMLFSQQVLKTYDIHIINFQTMYNVSSHNGKGSFYIAQSPVRWTAQSASHLFPPLADLFIPTPFSASPGCILAMLQLRAKTKSLTFPPLSIARYSFIQLSPSAMERTKMPNLRNGSQAGFEPGLS